MRANFSLHLENVLHFSTRMASGGGLKTAILTSSAYSSERTILSVFSAPKSHALMVFLMMLVNGWSYYIL